MLAEELCAAAAGRPRRRVLRQHRRRGRGLGDEVRARGDRPAALHLLRRAASTASRSGRSRWSATSSSRRASARCCPAASASRSATSSAWRPQLRSQGRRGLHRRADPGPHGDAAAGGLSAGAPRTLCRRYGTLFVARRDPDRARAHRQVVRARALGARAGLRARRQGAQRRLHAGRGDGHDAGDLPAGRSGTLERCYVHQSTYGRNRLSMAAGLATLRIIERDGWSSTPRAWAACCSTGSPSCQQRYEMIKEVRGSGLMIGIELCAPRSRGRAAELAPDPHGERGAVPAADRDPAAPRPRRDHDGRRQERRDQAAAAADAHRGARRTASSPRSTRCSPTATAPRARTGRSCATSRPRRSRVDPRASARRSRAATLPRQAGRSARRARSAWSPARPASSAGASRSGWWPRATRCAASCAPSSDTARLEELDVEIAVGDLTRRRLARPRGGRAAATCSTAVHASPTGPPREEITRRQRGGHAEPARGLRRRIAWRAIVHFSTTDVYGYPGRAAIDETPRRDAVSQLVRADQARGRGRGSPRGARHTSSTWSSCARQPSTAPAPPRSSARSRARCAAATCSWSTAVARSPASASSTTWSTRRSSRSATRPHPARRSTSATASTSPGRSSRTAWPRVWGARGCAGACRTGVRTPSASHSSTATECCGGPPV